LRLLAIATVIVAFCTIVLGSWTRINGAGLTCPDWPLCHGRLFPALGDGTLFEWAHRLLAFSITPLGFSLLWAAWRKRERSPFIAPTTIAIAALFLAQVLLGAATVKLANSPASVVLHWGTAMAFIASACSMAVFAAAIERGESASQDVSRGA